MAKRTEKVQPQGSSTEGILAKFDKLASMSDKQRTEYIHNVTQRAAKVKMTEQDYVMEMAADGYFQNEDGDIVTD